MVGMLQIITYLLCVYLVFKAIEIFQIALVSTPKSSNVKLLGIALGVAMLMISLGVGYVFINWIDSQASSLQNNMPKFP